MWSTLLPKLSYEVEFCTFVWIESQGSIDGAGWSLDRGQVSSTGTSSTRTKEGEQTMDHLFV